MLIIQGTKVRASRLKAIKRDDRYFECCVARIGRRGGGRYVATASAYAYVRGRVIGSGDVSEAAARQWGGGSGDARGSASRQRRSLAQYTYRIPRAARLLQLGRLQRARVSLEAFFCVRADYNRKRSQAKLKVYVLVSRQVRLIVRPAIRRRHPDAKTHRPHNETFR